MIQYKQGIYLHQPQYPQLHKFYPTVCICDRVEFCRRLKQTCKKLKNDVIQIVTFLIVSYNIKGKVMEEVPKAFNILKDFNLVWLDPNVNNSENSGYQLLLKAKFNEAFFVPNPSDVINVIDASSKPVVFISCGSSYEEVKASVQPKTYVVAIIIFCFYLEKFKHYKVECKKVVDVTNTFDNLEKALKNVHCEYMHFLRFYESRSEKTFYSQEDKDMIIESFKQEFGTDTFSVFYPLGMKLVNIKEMLTPKVFDEIEIAAKYDDELERDIELIKNVLDHLRKNNNMENIIESYTMEKLYYMLNRYLRYGKAEGFKLFKEYTFCLKGSMCELGIPVIEKGKKLYRGLELSEKFLNEYVNNTGKIVLLNAFTSTSTSIEEATEFARDNPTIFEITLVDLDEEFDKFITEFKFPEENGVFFPVDISEKSYFSKEKEVLFPPFYPMKIVKVCEVKINGKSYKKVIAEAPFSVCVAGKGWSNNFLKKFADNMEWNKIYLEKIAELIEKNVMDKLSIGNLSIQMNSKY
eukprot:TRINITY_DN585_c0_g1_i2.p1 TRINITY_DN585_c0_g1~~TRINITY_DN585_c0_g1_i2.p1  ORF type:complete len:522 (-),score=68.21 TRINITY_DN585_c0_g1_i2:374-1939(-)